jgi:hypothetical protein
MYPDPFGFTDQDIIKKHIIGHCVSKKSHDGITLMDSIALSISGVVLYKCIDIIVDCVVDGLPL